jgi:hypothetical protein
MPGVFPSPSTLSGAQVLVPASFVDFATSMDFPDFRGNQVSDSIHSLMFAISIAEPHGAPSVLRPASDEIRLVVETRVLLAVTMPPALPSVGCVFVCCDILCSCSASTSARPCGWAALAIAQTKPANSRAIAAVTTVSGLPAAPTCDTVGQSFLRLPRGVADRFGQTFLPQQLLATDPCREPIAPGGLDKHPPCRAAAPSPRAAAGVLGRHQTEIGHELASIGEARDVAEFGNQRCRNHRRHACSACSACTTVASDQSGSAASMWASRRSRRAVAASTAAMQSSSTM